jgi:hypothetical protein
VERNPAEAVLVAVPWDYRWSSARAYELGEGDPLLAANPWYEALAPDQKPPLFVPGSPN